MVDWLGIVFGFAKSHALNSEGSENAGMRDQRLALEWIRDNIAQFGGASDKITVYGQSSGGMTPRLYSRSQPSMMAFCGQGLT